MTTLLLTSGCYYKIRDVGSGRTYYTTSIENKWGGAIVIKDAKSKATVTLQNSEVHSISKEEFNRQLKAKPVNALESLLGIIGL